MSVDQDVVEQPTVDERLDRLYAELADLKRAVILSRVSDEVVPSPSTSSVLRALRGAAAEVSALWEGPGAVEEIRSQRGA